MIQGFTDPQLGAKPTASPSLQERTTTVSAVAGSLGMKVFKGGAKTAFLQGSVGDQELHCEPIEELAQALGLEHHQSMCEIAKIGVRFDRCSESLVGTCGNRHE